MLQKEKYNIILLHQVPNSPETNLLDLGVWRALQSIVEKLSFQDRYDKEVLAAKVEQAWKDMKPSMLEKVFIFQI